MTKALGVPGLTISDKGDTPTLTFDLDLIIIGYLACHWADTGSAYRCAMPAWGTEYRQRAVTEGNDRWIVTKEIRWYDGKTSRPAKDDDDPALKVLGLRFVKRINALNGGEESKQWWIPMRACKSARLVIEGVEVL